MDILSYYQNDRCVARYTLQQDGKVYTLGSAPDNDFVVNHAQVAPHQLQIQFENGIYHFMTMVDDNTMLESFTLPVDCWLDLPEDKKVWLDQQQTAGYLLFQSKVAAPPKTRPKTKSQEVMKAAAETTKTAPTTDEATAPARQKSTASIAKTESNKAKLSQTGENERPQANARSRATSSLPKMPERKTEKSVHAEPSAKPKDSPNKSERLAEAKPAVVAADEESVTVTNLWQDDKPTLPLVSDAPTGEELKLAPEGGWDQETLLYNARQKSGAKPDLDKISSFAGRYAVLGVLGKGGMGVVYKVKDEKMNRVVALKLLMIKEKETLELVQRFLSEARTIAKLHHSNIVGVHDIGVHEGMPYFTMDFIDGQEINKCLENLKPRQAMQWMLALCEAVQYIHDCGVIHRDLKPSNVMVQNNQPVLMDFGIARDETSHAVLTAAGKSLGTPVYMSPEQARGQTSQIDGQSDVYGLGAIFYELLTKRPPFVGTPIQVIYKVCNIEPTPIATINPSVPRDICTIVEKAMCKEKSFRYLSAKDMANDIRRYLQGLCIHAKPLSVSQQLLKLFRQNRNVSYGLLGGAALLVIILGTFFYSLHTSAAGKQRKINELMETAAQLREQAKTGAEDTITSYIRASENYTRVLGLDPLHAQAQKDKGATLVDIARHASEVLRDYNFARAMYSSALQIDISDEKVKNDLELTIKQDLANMQKKEKEEKLAVHNMFNKICERLRERR